MTTENDKVDQITTRVVIVDDSRVMREIIAATLEAIPCIEVVGRASDPYEARDVVISTTPDVITLDLEMPKMNGLDFLRLIMNRRPTPVIMVSGTTAKGTDNTLIAMESGAFGFVTKPKDQKGWGPFRAEIVAMVLAAAKSKHGRMSLAQHDAARHNAKPAKKTGIQRPLSSIAKCSGQPDKLERYASFRLIAIGASTGGVTAIDHLIRSLSDTAPPTVIVQHMPKKFITRFTQRLADNSCQDIAEATDGEILMPGMVRIAPGNGHLEIVDFNGKLQCRISDDPPINMHKPSIDRLFSSVAKELDKRAIGIILTGMGRDGAAGLLKMRNLGALTFGESESSCVVYGMPKAAMRIGAVGSEMTVENIAKFIRANF